MYEAGIQQSGASGEREFARLGTRLRAFETPLQRFQRLKDEVAEFRSEMEALAVRTLALRFAAAKIVCAWWGERERRMREAERALRLCAPCMFSM